MPAFPTVGTYPLTGVAALPNVTVAHPGEFWTNRIASGSIEPGVAVVPVNLAGKLAVRVATNSDDILQMGIAIRPIDVPDGATDSQYTTSLGPNEIRNIVLTAGEYCGVGYSGAFHLTLVKPRAWVPSELVKWNASATRPTGKDASTGAWDVTTDPTEALFEVMEFRPYSSNGLEGILTVRSFRGQF